MKRSRWAQTVLGDRHDLVYEILLQVPSAACGTRPAEFFNGWIRTSICDGAEKRSSENLIRSRGQRNDLPQSSNKYRTVLCERRGHACPGAQTCCASPTQTPARLANSPGLKSFHCPRWRIKFSLERFFRSVANLFAYPAVEKFCRASSAGGRQHLQ